MRSLGQFLTQHDYCPYKKDRLRQRDRHKHEVNTMWRQRQRSAWCIFKIRTPVIVSRPPAEREAWTRSCITAHRRNQLCQHLDLRLLAAITMRQSISTCYSSCRKSIQILSTINMNTLKFISVMIGEFEYICLYIYIFLFAYIFWLIPFILSIDFPLLPIVYILLTDLLAYITLYVLCAINPLLYAVNSFPVCCTLNLDFLHETQIESLFFLPTNIGNACQALCGEVWSYFLLHFKGRTGILPLPLIPKCRYYPNEFIITKSHFEYT